MLHRLLPLCLFTAWAVAASAGGPPPTAPAPYPDGRHPWRPAPRLDVLVDGVARPQYVARGTRYVEALRGREYEIRIANPFPVRVAVALAVDGLNTIDARHTTAAAARKWVLDPGETLTLSGWQVSQSQARRFHFTTEERSYGQALGQTANLGVITAVFFRERVIEPQLLVQERSEPRGRPAPDGEPAPGAAASARPADGPERSAALSSKSAPPPVRGADEYAATGIGRRTEHPVRQVSIDLEETPAASVELRYEYRAQLVRLGILPDGRPGADPLARRERSQGFSGGFCPDVRQ